MKTQNVAVCNTLCSTNRLQNRDAMKQQEKGMRRGYVCAVEGCQAEPYASYDGLQFCDVHLKEEWQAMLNEGV